MFLNQLIDDIFKFLYRFNCVYYRYNPNEISGNRPLAYIDTGLTRLFQSLAPPVGPDVGLYSAVD